MLNWNYVKRFWGYLRFMREFETGRCSSCRETSKLRSLWRSGRRRNWRRNREETTQKVTMKTNNENEDLENKIKEKKTFRNHNNQQFKIKEQNVATSSRSPWWAPISSRRESHRESPCVWGDHRSYRSSRHCSVLCIDAVVCDTVSGGGELTKIMSVWTVNTFNIRRRENLKL